MVQNQKYKSLSEILDIKKLMNVDRPIESANGLPNECYTSDHYLEYERNKIFSDKWTVIGVGSSIPNAGDVKPYNLLGIPLIIVRDKDLKIRVFHNVCSHRGFKLIDKPCTLKNVIRCPYHSWSYDFKGNLVATPHIGGLNVHSSEQFEKNQSNLKEVRSKIWMDIIFININANEIEFEDYIKPLEQRWSKFINRKDQKLFNLCSKVMLQIVEGRKPVIAKVHGAAFAAGCQLVASCDLAYSTKDALFATPGVNIGLFCSTPMVAVSRKINRKPMMKMLLTGEPIKANYAKEIGLINDCYSKSKLNSEVLKVAKTIASKSNLTIKIGKQAFYKQLEMPLKKAYAYTSKMMTINM
ncbi:enoyl-CoA hydratase-related protein, partial [Candidatus Pelagibacter sp.]|nr:enoyl-CoA hydratase-related protein [Candidatus Pelagibacter sp.]